MPTRAFNNIYTPTVQSLLYTMSEKQIKNTPWFKALSTSEKFMTLQRYGGNTSYYGSYKIIDSVSKENRIVKLVRNGYSSRPEFTETDMGEEITGNRQKSCKTLRGSSVIRNNILQLAADQPNIYLGAFIDARTVITGGFGEYILPNNMQRNPMNISINLHQASTSTEGVVSDVRDGTVNDKINELINSNLDYLDSVDTTISIEEIRTKVEASMRIGAALSIGIPEEIMALIKIPAEVSMEAEVDTSVSLDIDKSYFIAKINTIGYTAKVSRTSVKDLYSGDISEISENGLYVSSIGYGRSIYMLLKASNIDLDSRYEFKEEAKVAIEDIGVNGSVNGNLRAYFENNNLTVHIVAIGTKPINISTISNYDEFVDVLQKIHSSGTQTYRPISYTLDFLDGSGTALVEAFDKSYYSKCTKIAKLYKVTLKKIKATTVVDLGGDEEIYGKIKIEAFIYTGNGSERLLEISNGESSYLFDKDQNEYIIVKNQDYIIDEDRVFIIPTDEYGNIRENIYFRVSFRLKDKVDRIEDFLNNDGYVKYDKADSMHNIRDISSGILKTRTLREVNGNAEISITYSIKPV